MQYSKLFALQAAIDSMTRSLALEWGYYGIRVVAVAPGWTADTTGVAAFNPLPSQPKLLPQ